MKENERLYYVLYSRKMASGERLKLRAVWTESNLAWYFLNYAPKYDYIIDSARIATQAEIEEFTPKEDEEAYP